MKDGSLSRLAGPLAARSERAASGPAKRVALLILLCLLGCNDGPTTQPAPPQDDRAQSLPTTQMTIAGKPFTLQVADEDKERQVGLMYRRSLQRDHGMIFVFATESPRSFWMKNVPIDLDIIYLDRAGKIVSFHTMRAYDESGTPSGGEAQYAIELNAGVAKELGLSVGQVLDIPPGLRDQGR